ncbi:MAG: MarR family transcriptional regulator [Cyanobacteria bacterium QH_8_48_120]|nr:MAG: MarR family transcriptional regulator [Cyanobacteria bacterium QH_1_48_107]PSO58928.1 MAG: MarR family transcriptional regulator [Cyanobacteria bacterium QH_10_48_56]PSO61224.1 MAG: MarR family transcriptional regulator [Cyanobacteria bacterium QH_7_48_89]PSO64858.1 MAG: MarR family transcriptional regulator [Cyanobacteria bacterium QH_6_48_35]PSO66153.1 MAG: MarR family transcriptional regulator [Cyanobacteria bacterium QH_2_48_84]PSO69771.1 MAG: MarR family transcriptional regulator 
MGNISSVHYQQLPLPVIRIIEPTPGPTTTERILALIETHPQGMTIREICLTLNRPFSMVQRCLKPLISSKKVYARASESGRHRVYYPSSTKED